MPQFSPESLSSELRSLGISATKRLCVAFSGGLDSTVLLHALAHLAREPGRLRAAHVDHQLHAQSRQWRVHCERVAARLGVPFAALTVEVRTAEEGVEAGARRARYDALRGLLQPDEVLLTAHHADDQLETMLLALVRGAGVRGLSGVLREQRFGAGRLARPLLAYSRAELEAWAQAEHLEWLDDPSNENTTLDRNFLRAEVAPLLRRRWPAAAPSAARSAGHLQDADALLGALGDVDLALVSVGPNLDVKRLLELDPARRRNVLRQWMRRRGVRAPATRKLSAIEHELLTAANDRTPCVAWDEVELRRYRGQLYLDARLEAFDDAPLAWDPRATLELPGALGALSLRRMTTEERRNAPLLSLRQLAPVLSVRFRVGGERLRPAGDAHRRSLKKMLQAVGAPPWRRRRLPLIYSADRLAAVGDLWVAEEFAAGVGEEGARIVWTK